MRKGWLLLWFTGFALLLALVTHHGWAKVVSALAVAGFGMIWVAAYHVAPLSADTLAWRFLLTPRQRVPFGSLLWMRWLAESVNNLLPVAQVGGEFLKTRLLMLRRVPGPIAGASAVVDLTTSVITQVVFCATGVLLLGHRGNGSDTLWELLLGVGVLSSLVLGFYFAQRAGLFFYLARALERIGGHRDWLALSGSAAALGQAVDALYRRKGAFWTAFLFHLSGWIIGAGEVWLALYLLGHPVTLLDAFILESLIMAVRGAAFAIPGALGVQEGGLMVMAPWVGLPPETGLSLSLVKRVREFMLGIPGLIVWHIVETRHAMGRAVSRRA